MAEFSWLQVILVLVSLLGSTLEAGATRPQSTVKASACDCTDHYYIDEVPFHVVECDYITTTETVTCMDNFLSNITDERLEAIELNIGYSNLDLIPDDFLVQYPIYDLQFFSCSLHEIPYRILNPICFRLGSLIIAQNDIDTIPAQGFNNCSELMYLVLNDNKIKSVSPQAFVGSEQLVILDFQLNNLQNVSNFPGLVALEELVLLENEINHVDKDAFKDMSNLVLFYLNFNQITTLEEGTFDPLVNANLLVELEGNPFYCDCHLQWLQDWLNTKPLSDNPYCVAPVQGPIKTIDFCAPSGSLAPRKSPKLTHRISNYNYKKMHGK